MSTPAAPTPHSNGTPPGRQTSPLVWILVAVGGVVVLGGLLMLAGGLFVYSKAKQAGLDPQLMRENPGLAVAKMAAAVNPEVEVVDVNERRGVITLREKKTGKTVTLDFEDVKEGRISFESDEGERFTVEATGKGDAGSVTFRSSEGTLRVGAGSEKIPAWIPAYPGSSPQGTMSAHGGESEQGAFHFTTSDPAEKVISYYASALKQAGFKVTTNIMQQDGKESGGMVSGQAEERNRQVMILVGAESGVTSVNVTFSDKIS